MWCNGNTQDWKSWVRGSTPRMWHFLILQIFIAIYIFLLNQLNKWYNIIYLIFLIKIEQNLISFIIWLVIISNGIWIRILHLNWNLLLFNNKLKNACNFFSRKYFTNKTISLFFSTNRKIISCNYITLNISICLHKEILIQSIIFINLLSFIKFYELF